jgi:hypothetical protein
MTPLAATSCPDAGRWRAWLDDRADPVLADHLGGCPACQRVVEGLRSNAAFAAAALGLLGPKRLPTEAEIAAARERVEMAEAGPGSPAAEPLILAARRRRAPTAGPWRLVAAGVAAAVAVAAVAFTPQGQALASQFLAQFRSEQVAAIEVSPQSQQAIQRTLQTLGDLGTVEYPNGARNPNEAARSANAAKQPSASLADASRRVGFRVTQPDPSALPPGVDKTPQIAVVPAQTLRFRFDLAKAQAHFKAQGHDVAIPAKFDGATLVVNMPAGVLLTYQSTDQASREALVVGEAGEVTVGTEGNASLEEMRDFLLGLPGLPTDTVNQLKAIQDWQHTLPIPIPTNQVRWQRATIQGNPGLLLNDNTGIGSAAIVQAGGHIYGWAGSLKATDLMNVAAHTPLSR